MDAWEAATKQMKAIAQAERIFMAPCYSSFPLLKWVSFDIFTMQGSNYEQFLAR
jgi:hypothetical protein